MTISVQKLPTTGATGARSGSSANWGAASNITADDDINVAAVSLRPMSNGNYSNYLVGTSFGFSIPNNAIIRGIVLDIERKQTSSGFYKDSIVQIYRGGDLSASTNKASASDWPTSLTVASYGSPTDLWGLSWDVRNSDFGSQFQVALSTELHADNTSADANVDVFKVTVYYDLTSATDFF